MIKTELNPITLNSNELQDLYVECMYSLTLNYLTSKKSEKSENATRVFGTPSRVFGKCHRGFWK